MRLNDTFVRFGKRHAASMEKKAFDSAFVAAVKSAVRVRTVDQIARVPKRQDVRFEYQDYVSAARALGLMDDVRSGVPRGSYRGVVPVRYKGRRVFVTPVSFVEKRP
jgi:alpha-1,3-mannosyl-glycoprotein beta-1,2-N-acetylglucosaminyltransferase